MSMHPTRNYFAEFKGENDLFIETGSFRGDGIQLALEAGYKDIFSIDNDYKSIEFCEDRFAENENIYTFYGESPNGLRAAFSYSRNIRRRATIWLDAHWQMLENTEPGKNPFPLLDEIMVINKFGNRNDHTILIDDMLIMQKSITGYDFQTIKGYLQMINKNYVFRELPNPVINGILLAYIP